MMEENNKIIDGGSKTVQSSSSTSYISSLSDELLVEILCRLNSSENAILCKCICKRWFSIINTNPSSDSYFKRRWRKTRSKVNKEEEKEEEELPFALLTQYRRRPATEHLLTGEIPRLIDYSIRSNYKNLLSFKSLLEDISPHIYIIATCKDLVVCCPRKNDHSIYYICNPFTKQWTVLPPPPRLPKLTAVLGVRVAVIFTNEDGYGFKFMLVRVVHCISLVTKVLSHDGFVRKPRNVKRFKVEIFSSGGEGSGGWKEMVNVPECLYSSEAEMLVWLSSSELYWLSSSQEIIGLKFANNSDANVTSYTRFSLPSHNEEDTRRARGSLIGVCRGCLRIAKLVNIRDGNDTTRHGVKLIIWELNNHGQSWDLVHELDLSEIEDLTDSSLARSCYHNERFRASVLAFDPHDRDTVYLYWFLDLPNVPSYIFLCNVRRRTIRLIREVSGLWHACGGFPILQPFWPTRVPRKLT